MKNEIEIREASAGETFERDFLGQGEVVVRREGHSRVRHLFTLNGRTIGRLRWRGLRRAIYEAEGITFYINVGPLDRRISIATNDGNESFLIEKSRANPRREDMRIEMAEGDDFFLNRNCPGSFRSSESIEVHKRFYRSNLLVFRFDAERRTQTTVRVEITSVMKWESRYLHRLLALVVCRIILERRHSGAKPLRVKEKTCAFTTHKRGHGRRRV
jgi:hypothetical protein